MISHPCPNLTYLEDSKMEITLPSLAFGYSRVLLDTRDRFQGTFVGRKEHLKRALIPVDDNSKVVPCFVTKRGFVNYVEGVVKDLDVARVFGGKGSRWVRKG